MSVLRDWNPTDLARAAKVSVNQIYAWFHQGHLRGAINERGVLRLPLTESVAVFALRDGEDPEQARQELMAGRDLWRSPDHHDRRSKEELENTLQDFLVSNRLPPPEHRTWGDGDPRKEVE